MKKEFQIDQLNAIAQDVLNKASSLYSQQTVIIALSGELGAGKTTLTQEISHLLGVSENIISPTFVIMKRYQTNHKIFTTLVHIDAYRLNSSEELNHLGFQEVSTDPHTLIILEWPEKVPECLNGHIVLKINLEHKDEKTRQIEF